MGMEREREREKEQVFVVEGRDYVGEVFVKMVEWRSKKITSTKYLNSFVGVGFGREISR